MHVDIQGAEHEVLAASREALDRKVARIHIETHSDEVEVQLRELFSGLGWTSVWDFAQNTRNETPYGEMLFVGGLQTWRNPRL